ncbi:WAT1-related protein [Platanthera guangdongensis]|uniref:WAT1-related protein n=1 Tax=Platanthera guangdongensis TaxID=2320717 RepID=A0ABR2N485_9ASPA
MGEGGGCCRSWWVLEGPAMGTMVMVQIAVAGVNIFYKLAINDGMDMKILVAYRYLFATVSLCPFAFFFERKNRPRLTCKILMQAFFCGLFG